MEKIEKYEPNHLSLLGDMYASFPEDIAVKLRSELGLEDITNEITIDAVKTPGYFMRTANMIGRTIAKPFHYVSRPVKALVAASALVVGGATVAMATDHEDNAYDAQMVGDLDVNQTTIDGNYVASLEDNRVINIIDVESGSEMQIAGNHYQVGSMKMAGDVLQYTTMSLQGTEGLYKLNEFDMTTSQTVVLKEELSADEPDFYINQDTDGLNSVYVDNNSVVLNGETIYDLGNNSLPSVNDDAVAFASEQTEDNKTTQRVVTISNGEINTVYSGNQSVEFVEFLDGNVVYGLENLLDNKTVDLHVGDAIREIPSGMFDVDNGNLTWIEQIENGFEIKLYNFETDQTETVYVSSSEMRNPQISENLVTWEQKHGLSDSFKAWYSNVTDLITEEQVIPIPTEDRDRDGVIDKDDNCVDVSNYDQLDSDNNGIGDACDDELITLPEKTDYSGAIAIGAGLSVIGLIYFRNRKNQDSEEDSDDNGGLENIFSDKEIKTIAEEVVESRIEEAWDNTDPSYNITTPEASEPYFSDIENSEDDSLVEDKSEAEHRRDMEKSEAFFGPARDTFLEKIKDDDGSVTVVNVGEGESAIINIGTEYISDSPKEDKDWDNVFASEGEVMTDKYTGQDHILDPEVTVPALTRTEVYESRKPELRILANQRGIDTTNMKVPELKSAILASMDEEE